MKHHSSVSLVVELNLAHFLCFFGVATYGWTIPGQGAEHFLPLDGPGIGVVLGVDI